MRRPAILLLTVLLLLSVLSVPYLREGSVPDEPRPLQEGPELIDPSAVPDTPSSPMEPPETGAFLLGTVLTPDGGPAEGARVSWFHVDEDALTAPPGRKATTERDGGFRIECPSERTLVLVIRHPRYRSLTVKAEPNREATWRLQAGGSLTGEVVTADGEAVRGAPVLAIGRGYRRKKAGDPREAFWGPGVDAAMARTDDAGRFEICGLGKGHYEVAPAVPGMIREDIKDVAPVLLRPGEHHRFVVRPTFITAYRLVDRHTGKPLAVSGFHYVTPDVPYEPLYYPSGQEVWFGGAPLGHRSDPSGRGCSIQLFAMLTGRITPSATATVYARIPGYEPAKVKIPIQLPWAERETRIHDVVLEPTSALGRIRARFTDAFGKPITGLRVALLLDCEGDDTVTNVSLVPGTKGIAEFRLPAGCYEARHPNEKRGRGQHWRTTLRPVVAGETTDWEFSLQSTFVLFRLVDESERPIHPAAHTRASSSQGSGPVVLRCNWMGTGSSGRPGSIGPDVEGSRFALIQGADLPPGIAGQQGPFQPGRRTFEVFCPRHAPARVTADLTPGTVHRLTVVMEPIDTDDWYPPHLVDER
ncbi:MAG: hypothetical protein ABFS86_04140 [Planctomycetota bacterium]